MLRNAQVIRYDLAEFPFIAILERLVFKAHPLTALHHYWRRSKVRRGNAADLGYSDNLALRALMQSLPDDSPFFRLYHRFAHQVVSPLFGGGISYSKRPKMRIHLAGTTSVSSWHRDTDVTHRGDQINVFLPFTSCFGTNTLWCESDYGAKDYAPIRLEPGEAFLFDGGFLDHGTVANETDVTRCSLDFRFAPTRPVLVPPWSRILSGRPPELGGDPFERSASRPSRPAPDGAPPF
jgi:hypothetical protein